MRRIPSDGDARLEQIAVVGLVLRRNAYRYWFQALEARRGLEVRALLTTMQRGSALRTISPPIDVGGQRRRAVVAARRRHRLYHPRQPRTGDIDRRTWTLRTRALLAPRSAVSGILAARVHIAALPVLAIAFHILVTEAGAYSFTETVTVQRSRRCVERLRETAMRLFGSGSRSARECLNHYVPRTGRGIQ